MSSSSSTTHARGRVAVKAAPPAGPSRTQTIWTLVLAGIWAALIAFGLISISGPRWLERLSHRGMDSEAQAYRHLGDNELKNGNYALAAAQYLRSLEIHPDQPDVTVNLGIAYLKSGNRPAGKAALRRAAGLATTPRLRVVIAIHLGELSAKEGKAEEAARHYREALAVGARPGLAYQRLGALALERGDFAAAKEAFERVLQAQMDPEVPYAEMIQRTTEQAEEDPDARRWLESIGGQGLAGSDWNRYDVESIEQMHATDPEIAKTHNHLGLIAYQMGDADGAIGHFETSLAIWPRNPDASRNLQIIRSAQVRTAP